MSTNKNGIADFNGVKANPNNNGRKYQWVSDGGVTLEQVECDHGETRIIKKDGEDIVQCVFCGLHIWTVE